MSTDLTLSNDNLKDNLVEINPNHIIDIKTVQSSAIKILVEALKEILTDTNLIIDETGIKLVAMDSTKTVLIYMKLEANKFQWGESDGN